MSHSLLAVLHCIRHDHDQHLMLLAGLVCAIGVYASFALATHTMRSTSSMRVRWGVVSILASASTAWATHFIVLLAFEPRMPVAFDPTLTAVSLLCAIVGIGLGVYLALGQRDPRRRFAAGLVVGLGIAFLHYVGQAAYLVQGTVDWNLWMVASSIALSMPISGLALVAAAHRYRQWRRTAAPLLLFSIALLHFFGMAAMTLRHDPAMRLPADAASPHDITPVVASVSLALLALAVLGWRLDVAAKLRTRRDRQRLQILADVALEGLIVCNGDEVVTVNSSLAALSGHDRNELTGASARSLLPGVELERLPEREERDAELVGKDGKAVPVRVLRAELPLGRRRQTVIAVRDQRERLRTEAQIETLAFTDPLTAVANRTKFYDLLAAQASSLQESDHRFAVLMIDLDRFKPVNDMLGHAAGDIILRMVADRLTSILRQGDLLARLGGDEFAVLQANVLTADAAMVLAERIVAEIGSRPFILEGQQVQIGASVGVAYAPADGADPSVLLHNADLALYAAKADGKGVARRFDLALDERMRARRTMETGLRRALDENQLEVHYQPLVETQSRAIRFVEALVRWRHPDRGLIPPADFIPLAEETGLIIPLGEWVLSTACAEAATWPDDVSVAVNVSPIQFRDSAIVPMVRSVLEATRLAPERLELEITEGSLLTDEKRSLATLNELREAGVRISMDDFGTGYSSLSYLRKFPFDKIKIDQSFVRLLPDDEDSVAIVRAIINLGKCLGMSTTVEGVETLDQFDFSVAEGCDSIQGYHISKPVPPDELAVLLGFEREADQIMRAA